jgi:putative membrane-bound dehydrogenase-like protein
MFVPMKEGEDRPSGPPQILLDGWGYQDTHETLNTFIWGPDGWLYGCHGVFTHSRVGKPGTPDDRRIPINAGIWRYHPTRHVFEVFAHGTSNPWGLDFNDYGEAFCEACVIPHAFHIIQNARYHRQAGQHFNPHTYADIQTIADHRHYVGATPHGGNNRSDSAGGGHAHCGTMIYLGGTWPEKYRGQMFMGNIHGRRLNVDILKPKGSGYVAAHGPDFLLANDAWARFINLRYGPDGNVYLIDWYDKQACHTGKPEIWDRTNGRIYKICYRGAKPAQVDLRKMSDAELIKLQLHENDWYVRHARRILQERAKLSEEDAEELAKIALEHQDATRRLRGLWALHTTRTLTAEHVTKALQDKDAHVRGWAIQLALEDREQALVNVEQLVERAKKEKSPVGRRYLASALQRLECNEREPVLEQLLGWADDAEDHNLLLLYWYGLEPLAGLEDHRERALSMAAATDVPRILDFTVRRMAADASGPVLDAILRRLLKVSDVKVQLVMLRALNDALKGRRLVEMPRTWENDVYPILVQSSDAEVRGQLQSLAVIFGDRRALNRMRETLVSESAEPALRQQALATLLAARDPKACGGRHCERWPPTTMRRRPSRFSLVMPSSLAMRNATL